MRPATAQAHPAASGATRRARPAHASSSRPASRPLAARRPPSFRAALLALAGLALPAAATAIDLGDASVLSRQGQRLELAIPFGSAPGERVSATRFKVVSVESPDNGSSVPDPARFTIARPERRNVVYLRSDRPVEQERLRIVVAVTGLDQPDTAAAYDIVIPPPRFAPAAASPGRRPRGR